MVPLCTFHVEKLMTYTYEQVLMYARELINSHIADCSAAIGDEQDKAVPDQARIEKMRERACALIIERRQMAICDDVSAGNVIAKYRRTSMLRV